MSSTSQANVLWTPHPKQIEALERSEFEILYGGSRGGGKTDAGLAWLAEETHHPKYRALVLRRNSEDLKDWTDRATQLYSRLANPGVRTGNPPEFHFRSGAIIRTGHLNDTDAYTKYQGHEYHRILIEELTQIPEEKNYLRILSSCRSVVPDLKPQVFLTTNPGGKGHMWVKKRFIDVVPPGTTFWEHGRSRIFIQATMDDNPTLMQNDPNYVANIESLKDSDYETYMAWRFGDWDRFAGQVFKEFSRVKHVLSPLLPRKGDHFLSMDWGYSENSAFAAYLHCVLKMKSEDGQNFQRVVTYKEWYGNQKTPHEWAEIIYADCQKMGITPLKGFCDPAMFNTQTDGSISISRLMRQKWKELKGDDWLLLTKANNNRIARVATTHNWLSLCPDTLPYWLITESCPNLLRTLPMLVYDEHHVEDVDTDQEDHAFDAVGYFLMMVKFIAIKAGAHTYHLRAKPAEKRYNAAQEELSIDPKEWAKQYSK
jgi:hypothetical protein